MEAQGRIVRGIVMGSCVGWTVRAAVGSVSYECWTVILSNRCIFSWLKLHGYAGSVRHNMSLAQRMMGVMARCVMGDDKIILYHTLFVSTSHRYIPYILHTSNHTESSVGINFFTMSKSPGKAPSLAFSLTATPPIVLKLSHLSGVCGSSGSQGDGDTPGPPPSDAKGWCWLQMASPQQGAKT